MNDIHPQSPSSLPPVLTRFLHNFGRVQLVFIALGVAWLAITAFTAQPAQSAPIQLAQKGFMAPDFSLLDTAGQETSLADFKGQAVILNFWATWCPPCKAEMPDLQKAYTLQKEQGLVIIGINRTDQDDPAEAAAFIQNYGLTFPILLDPTGKVAQAYQVSALPTTIFIRPDGIIHKVIVGGPLPQALLLAEFQQMQQGVP